VIHDRTMFGVCIESIKNDLNVYAGTRLSTPDEYIHNIIRVPIPMRLTRSRKMAVYIFIHRIFIRYLNKQGVYFVNNFPTATLL